MSGNAAPVAARRVRGAAARQGRDAGGARRPGVDDARARRLRAGDRPGRGRRGHRRRPRAHREHLDDGGARRRRVPDAGWSSTATAPRRRSCGAADVLEELGVVIDLPGDGVARCVDEVGIGFCFAPVFHAGMRHAGPTRARTRHPDRLQLPRPADQSRARGRRRDRLRRPADGAGHGRRARRPRRLRAGVPRRRRVGRADDHDHVVGVGASATARSPRRRSTRPRSASRR